MERKLLFLILAFSVVIVGGVVFMMLPEEDGEAPPVPNEAKVQEILPEQVVPTESPLEKTESAERMDILPEEDALLGTMGMPASFRKALGGFKGRVVEEGGIPVADLEVEVLGAGFLDFFHDGAALLADEPPPFKAKSVKSRTGEDGTFYLPGVFPRAFYVLSVDPEGSRTFARIIDNLPGPKEIVDLGDIVLPPCAVLFGRIVDESGNPVAGARVRATDLPPLIYLSGVQDYKKGGSFLVQSRFIRNDVLEVPPAFDSLFDRLPFPKTLSAADGTFRLEGVPRGLVVVLTDKPGYATSKRGPVSTKRGGEKDLEDVIITRGKALSGRVQTLDGKPLAGAEVRVGSIYSFDEIVCMQPSLFSDEDGTFTQTGVDSLSAMVVARLRKNDPWVITGPHNPLSSQVVVDLPATHDLRVTVKDKEGSLINDAKIKVRNRSFLGNVPLMNTPRLFKGRVERLDDGVLLVRELPPSDYEVMVGAKGFATTLTRVSVTSEPADVEVVLAPARTAQVRVLARETNEPVEWAEVYTFDDDQDWIENPVRIVRSRTDEAGMSVLDNLSEGTHKLSVSHPGYAVATEELEVPCKEEKVVLLETGGAMEGVVYRNRTEHEPPYLLMMEPRFRGNSPEAETPIFRITDLEGSFQAHNLNPGQWSIEVQRRLFDRGPLGLVEYADFRSLHRTRVEVEVGKTTQVEIYLGDEKTKPGAPVSGMVLVNGEPAREMKVRIWAGKNYSATVDAGGGYSFPKIPVGEHGISVTKAVTQEGSVSFSLYQEITVEENIPLYEDFDLLTGSLSGKIVAEESGEPLPGKHDIVISSEDEKSMYNAWIRADTDEDGSFHFAEVPMGVYSISCYSEKITVEPLTNVKVLPGNHTGPVTLLRKTPVLVSGKVILPGGYKNPEQVMLWFVQGEGEESISGGRVVMADPTTHTFETQSILPGKYQVYLYVDKNFNDQSSTVLVVPSGGITGVILEF